MVKHHNHLNQYHQKYHQNNQKSITNQYSFLSSMIFICKWSNILEAIFNSTVNHHRNVTEKSLEICDQLGLNLNINDSSFRQMAPMQYPKIQWTITMISIRNHQKSMIRIKSSMDDPFLKQVAPIQRYNELSMWS